MAGKIKSEEIVQDDILKNLRESVITTETKTTALVFQLNAVNEALLDIKKSAKTIKGGIVDLGKTNTKDLDARSKAQRTSNQLAKDAIELDQMKQRLNQEILKSRKLEEQVKQAELNTQKKINQESKKTLTSYQLESRALKEMRDRYKDLATQRMNGIKLTRDEQKEMRNLVGQIRQSDTALNKIDATTGQFQRSVGNYPKLLGGFKNALGQLGLAFGAFQLAAGFGKTLVNFEEQAANMAKTLGVSVDVAKQLSRELANIDTRTSITDLQSIAAIGGQLGIEANQVVAFTESIDKLNVALGDEFTGGAEEITSVLGGMRNVLTDIKTDNAADDLLKLGNALNYIGAKGSATSPVIADFASRISGIGIPLGLTSDEVIGLSATLQELNVNAERGGTAVGAILQRITRDTKGFAELAGMDVKKFENLLNTDLLGAFKEVTKGFNTLKGDAVTQSKVLEKLGLTGSGASEVFLKLGGSIGLLEDRVTQAGDALKNTDSITQEFNVKNNTLGATMDKITKDFQKYVIGVDESGMVTGGLSNSLQFLHDNFDTIVSVLGQGLKAFILYKSVIISTGVAQKLFGNDTGKINFSLKQLTSNLKDGASASKGLGSALSGMGLTAILALFIEIGKEVYNIASGALLLEQRLKRFDEFQSLGAKTGSALSDKYTQSLEKRLKAIELMNVSEKEQNRLRKQAIDANKLAISKRLEELRVTHANIDAKRKEAITERDRFKKSVEGAGKVNLLNEVGSQKYVQLENSVSNLTAAEKGYVEIIKALETNLNGLGDKTHDLNVEEKNLTISTGKHGKAVKDLNTQLKDQNEYLSRQKELLHELGQMYVEFDISNLTDGIEVLKEKTLELARVLGNIENQALKEALTERFQLREYSINSVLSYEIDAIRDRYKIEKEEARKAIEENRVELLSQKDLTDDTRLKIEADYQDKLRKLEDENKQRDEDRDTEIRIKNEKASQDQINLKKETSKELEEIEKQTIEKIEEFNTEEEAKQLKRSQELDELEAKKRAERFDNERKFIELTTKFLEDQIDKRIALLEKESEAHKTQQDYFSGLAESGNINAQQSLAEEARLQREAEADKARLERRKLQLHAFSAFMTDYTNRLEKGENSGQALAGAIADKAVLEAIIATIPAFEHGGEHDGGLMMVNDAPGSKYKEIIQTPDGNIFSPKGRDVIMNAPKGTKIYTPDQWDDINSKMQAKDAFRNANSLGGNIAGNSFDITPLMKGFKSLEKAIKDKPETIYKAEEFVSGVLTVSKTERRKNIITRTETQFRPR